MQVAALEAAQEVDPVAAHIGAANTLVRQRDGSMKAYNTDWSAAIGAVEAGLGGQALHTVFCCRLHKISLSCASSEAVLSFDAE
jgi:shikimate 5-dehydrogenase